MAMEKIGVMGYLRAIGRPFGRAFQTTTTQRAELVTGRAAAMVQQPMNDQQKENGTGLARLQRALRCSSAGLAAAWKSEEAFRQELLAGLVLLPLGLWLGDSGVERALLAASVILVFIVEMLNSAVEAVVDRIGPERHELSGRAKDLGSAAVSFALLHFVVVWLFVLLG
jgi:diacylglycerol kinase (ATP)